MDPVGAATRAGVNPRPCNLLNNPNTQVALAYVHGETVKGIFMDSVVQNVLLDERNRRLVGAVKGLHGTIVPRVRNDAVRWFLKETTLPWLWFLDTDMQPATYTLPDMLDAVSGVGPCIASAATRGLVADGPKLTWLAEDGEGGLYFVLEPESRCTEILACGAACTLIHREVLVAVERNHTKDSWPWFGHDLVNGQRQGEDLTFCYRARAVGYHVYGVDTPVNHFKLMPI